MKSETFLPTTVGAVGVVLLLVNLFTAGDNLVAQLAFGLILFSITLAVLARRG